MKLQTSNSRESGIALIITLILLSVITFMAVTFLVVSRHASEAVTTVTQQAVAKQAADAAAQQAEARIVATMLGQTNGFKFGLTVSTNWTNLFYDTTQALGAVNVTNVNYYDVNGNLLTGNNYLQMLNNLLVLPRPPVFITTNAAYPPDFRFYLDLNRNGVYDPSTTNGVPVVVTNQFNIQETNYVGDPEWIGVLEHPDQPHSRSNQFVARYCFLAQPIGNSLDANSIHNDAKELSLIAGQDGFLRNQGVGSWEINLAGFLNGLNPNVWGYGAYDTNLPAPNGSGSVQNNGPAFGDAAAFLQYRYNGTFVNLPSFASLYTNGYASLIGSPTLNFIDYYPLGPLTTGVPSPAPLTQTAPNVNLSPGWSGADNPNHLFTPSDFFTAIPGPTPANSFSGRLYNLGFGPKYGLEDVNFNRYAFYRMLAQMGMESAPEPATKLNLNYVNIGGYSSTDFQAWADAPIYYPKGSLSTTNGALLFFTNGANRLLASQANFIVPWNGGFTNLSSGFIPVSPFNYYTPSVHRMLQLAANIYDNASPKPIVNPGDFDYPSVFRPLFNYNIDPVTGITNVWISGYLEEGTETGTNAAYNQPAYSLPQDLPTVISLINANSTKINIYGIPWVIGAKTNLPNFNQISLENFTALTREIQINKGSLTSPRSSWQTNIQYVLGISNSVLVEAWNSYQLPYPRAVDIGGLYTNTMILSNQNGLITVTPAADYSTNSGTNFQLPTVQPLTWFGIGTNLSDNPAASFRFPLMSSTIFLPSAIYSSNGTGAGIFTVVPSPFATLIPKTAGFPVPQLFYTVTNRLRMVMVDDATGRVIDYVQLEGMTDQRDLTGAGELEENDDWGPAGVWDTNRIPTNSSNPNDLLLGVQHQIDVSKNGPVFLESGYTTPATENDWNWSVMGIPGLSTPQDAVTSFNEFYQKETNLNPQIVMQVPFTPTRSVCVYYTWQANDPLVHYTLPDLTDLIDVGWSPQTNWVVTNYILANIGQLNKRYDPWGVPPNGGNASYNTNMALKDAQVTGSDAWQFPDTKFPSIGWLGRVHRGTPWQTVYMKSAPVDPTLWMNWTGNTLPNDAAATQPTNDWAIFDLFTTAPNDNASRGQLSVNQTNYAAWAALLDGVIVQTNDPVNGLIPVPIDPNAANNPLYTIFSGIAAQRANRPGGVFTRVGDILSAPELTTNSPYLTNGPLNTLNDAAYEWLPSQIMSLLRVGQPRYVIYAYGQSLKPANNSIVSGGQFYGTCTNYQITGEVATRTVVRFELPTGNLDPANPYTPWNPTHNPVMPQLFQNIPPPRTPFRAVVESYTVLPPQ